jgi:hypothetical protein
MAWVRWRLIYKVGGAGQQPFCVNYHFVIWRLLDVFELTVMYIAGVQSRKRAQWLARQRLIERRK